jgi:hypothetical protein
MDERKSMRNRDKKIFQIAVGRVIRKRRVFKGRYLGRTGLYIGMDPKHLNKIELGHKEVGSCILALLQIELGFNSDKYQTNESRMGKRLKMQSTSSLYSASNITSYRHLSASSHHHQSSLLPRFVVSLSKKGDQDK